MPITPPSGVVRSGGSVPPNQTSPTDAEISSKIRIKKLCYALIRGRGVISCKWYRVRVFYSASDLISTSIEVCSEAPGVLVFIKLLSP